MDAKDIILLLHPIAAVTIIFPLLGVVLHRALQVRQRRLTTRKDKILATVGQEHVQLGRWLTGSVVGIVLLALANDVLGKIVQNEIWNK
jgi:integral membrane sensor domain MASE1